jgi:hypothetical protein
MLADYLSRVRNATDTVVSNGTNAAALLPYPRRRERQLALANIRVGLIDFLSLGRCGLQSLVGERNSVMGKVQPISQRLVYEHRFLVKAAACRKRLLQEREPDEDFIAQINAAIQSKQHDLPKLFWNATFGSPEFEKLFARTSEPLSARQPETPSQGMTEALRYLIGLHARLGDPQLELNTHRLEQHYFDLQAQPYGGKVLRSIELLARALSGAATALEHRAATAPPLCFRARMTRSGRVLQVIFRKYYVEGVGPYVARVHQYGQEVLQLINQLAELQLEAAPPGFRNYYHKQLSLAANDGLWRAFTSAIEHHTRVWGLLLEQCDILPGDPVEPQDVRGD